MYKKIAAIAMCVLLAATLGACNSPDDSTATQTPAVTATVNPISSQAPGQTQTTPAEPLQTGESIGKTYSVDSAVAEFGAYTEYKTAYYPGNGCTYIQLTFANHVIELDDDQGQLSFAGNDDGGYTFGEKENALTAADKALKLPVSSYYWVGEAKDTVRGIAIGDSLETVKSKFLDCSANYTDDTTIYTVKDVAPNTQGEAANEVLGFYTGIDSSMMLGVAPTHLLMYESAPPQTEYTAFYFINNVVVAIAQGYENEP